ncbi:MAG: hypothetical protein IJT50_01070 [Lentisphaeria bacterium]|nr:hypothetical protein [Lentisphaeria bacterium]
MPFDRGSFSFTMFSLRDDLPDNAGDILGTRKACKLDEVTGEPSFGWVTGQHLLDTELDEGTARFGGVYFLTLRKAVRKIPASLLTALCRRAEEARMKESGKTFIGSKERKEIKESTIERNIMKMPPALSGISMVIVPHTRHLYLGASSQSQIDLFIEHFYQAFSLEPLQLTPAFVLAEEFDTTAAAFPALQITRHGNGGSAEESLGRDYLLYLWYLSETGKTVDTEDFGSFEVMLEAPLCLTGDGDDAGAGEATIKKGDSPIRGAEVKAALTVGKKLRKAKLTFTRANEIWSGTFDADNFSFSSFTLPEGEAQDRSEIFAERVEFLETFREVFVAGFRQYAKAMLDGKASGLISALKKWISDRDAI